jgi:hypothetical protein
MHAARPVRLIFGLFIIIFGEEYRLWSSSFYSFLQFYFTLSLLDPDTTSVCVPHVIWDTKIHTRTGQVKIDFYILYVYIFMAAWNKNDL